ncbi:MAG TPA: CHAD domain-containing protein [Candidatus Binatia bacterium]|nr:CHAD domain-containing protein [Candidatus Binatia bacterium]
MDLRFRLSALRLRGARGSGAERFDSVHWDTPDLRLAAWDSGLRHRRGRGWRLTLLSQAEDSGVRRLDLDLPGGPEAPPPRAVQLLSGYLRGAPLQPVARVRHLETHRCAGEVRVVHQVVSRIESGRAVARARRLSLRNRGEADDLKRPLAALRRAGLVPGPAPGLLAELLGPDAEPRWRPVALDPASPVVSVVSAALRDCVGRLVRNQAVLLEGSDPEGIHQARVACRRIRSDLQTFTPVLDPEWADGLRAELQPLADALGRVRDTDVLLMRLRTSAADHGLGGPGAARLLDGLASEREEAREALVRRLDSGEHRRQLDRLIDAALAPAVLPECAEEPAVAALMPLVTAGWRKLRRRVRGLSGRPADDELHRARILTKRCRYAVLALGPPLGEGPDETGTLLGELQDALGEQHDAVVAAEWLRRAADGETAFAAGVLYGVERERADAGRTAWRRQWKAVDRKRVWSWVR